MTFKVFKKTKSIKIMGETLSGAIHYFDEVGLNNAFKKLGWKLDRNGHILDKNGILVKCSCCKKPLTKTELSAFSPGSLRQICSDIRCYMLDMFRREKMR